MPTDTPTRVTIAPHALLDAALWHTTLPCPLDALETPPAWRALLVDPTARPHPPAPSPGDPERGGPALERREDAPGDHGQGCATKAAEITPATPATHFQAPPSLGSTENRDATPAGGSRPQRSKGKQTRWASPEGDGQHRQGGEAVRDLLRLGGFKPKGRDKPASEALVGAVRSGRLGPAQGINALVDLCNAASLWSGLPISVVDADLIDDLSCLRIALAEAGARYVFNPSGQEIDVGALLCLHDAQGPCASPVKDSQRTKTHEGTQSALWIVWGTRALEGRAEAVAAWCRQELEARLGAASQRVEVVR